MIQQLPPPTVSSAERALDLAWRIVYLSLVALVLWAFLPAGTREAIRRVIVAQLWVYQLGVWETRTPAWKREALEVRGKVRRPRGQAAP